MANLRCPPVDHGPAYGELHNGVCPDALSLTVHDSPDNCHKVQPTTQDAMSRSGASSQGRGSTMSRGRSTENGNATHTNMFNDDLEMGVPKLTVPKRSSDVSRSNTIAVEPPPEYTASAQTNLPSRTYLDAQLRYVVEEFTDGRIPAEAQGAVDGQSQPETSSKATMMVTELEAGSVTTIVNQHVSTLNTSSHKGAVAAIVHQYSSNKSNNSNSVRLEQMRRNNRNHSMKSVPVPKHALEDDVFKEAKQSSNTKSLSRGQTSILEAHRHGSPDSPKQKDSPSSQYTSSKYPTQGRAKLKRQHSVLSMQPQIIQDAVHAMQNSYNHLFRAGQESARDRKRFFSEAASHRVMYDPRSWFFTILRLHGRPPLGSAWWFVNIVGAVYAVLFNRGIITGELPVSVHGLTGACLMFLIVMRTTGAFKKWSEGLKAWTSIAAACRELMQQSVAYCDDELLGGTICAHSVAFAVSVRCVLRDEDIEISMLRGVMTDEEFSGLLTSTTPPLYCIHFIRHAIAAGLKSKSISAGPMALEASLRVLVNAFADCQRLVTPMPYIYVAHLRTFLLAYLVFLPCALLPLLGLPALAVLAILSYALIGLENTAVQLEDPFGTDANDLPLDEFCLSIQDYMLEVLDDRCVKEFYQRSNSQTGASLEAIEGGQNKMTLPIKTGRKSPKSKKSESPDGEDGDDGE